MHYYKRNLGDYAKKAGRLTMLQHGSYTLLIDACYDRETFPTLEQAIEWTWASTQDEIEAVKFVLGRFFHLGSDGVYTQDRILEELMDYHGKADKNKQIAIDRETKRREKSTNRARTVNETPPNQEPRTINQEPVIGKTARGTRLPTDFQPDMDFAEQQGVTASLIEAAKFRDYWNAQPGQKGVKLDWQATWRNWCRNAKKNPADVARQTVPAKPGPDPMQAVFAERDRNAAPIPQAIREQMAKLTNMVKQ